MRTPTLWTVQCGTTAYSAAIVTVEAASPEEACERAIEASNDTNAWRSLDHCGPTFVDALAPGDVNSPWSAEVPSSILPVPERYLERGEERIATREAQAFLERVAALTVAPTSPRGARRCRASRARLELLNALIGEARAIRERSRFLSAGAEA